MQLKKYALKWFLSLSFKIVTLTNYVILLWYWYNPFKEARLIHFLHRQKFKKSPGFFLKFVRITSKLLGNVMSLKHRIFCEKWRIDKKNSDINFLKFWVKTHMKIWRLTKNIFDINFVKFWVYIDFVIITPRVNAQILITYKNISATITQYKL